MIGKHQITAWFRSSKEQELWNECMDSRAAGPQEDDSYNLGTLKETQLVTLEEQLLGTLEWVQLWLIKETQISELLDDCIVK